jgi:hypothetical protein
LNLKATAGLPPFDGNVTSSMTSPFVTSILIRELTVTTLKPVNSANWGFEAIFSAFKIFHSIFKLISFTKFIFPLIMTSPPHFINILYKVFL